MEQKLSREKVEELVMKLIRFLQKWGLWQDTGIFANGNRYAHSYEKDMVFKRLNYVEFNENIKTEEYTSGIIGKPQNPCLSKKETCMEWVSYSNPEHILDMVYEGPLQMLLSYETYETEKQNISSEAWDYIFENTDILESYLIEKYGCADAEGFMEQILEDKMYNPDYTHWDPLVFDTWAEYQEFLNGESYQDEEEKHIPLYQRYETYREYLEDMDKLDDTTVMKREVELLWEKMVQDAKAEYITAAPNNEREIISLPEMREYLVNKFTSIFEKYGLWYEYGFNWSLTCYRINKDG